MDELQRMGLTQFLESFVQPERTDSMSADEQKLVELCCEGTPLRRNDKDEGFAAELDKLLQAAKDKGMPVNLELKTTSGATPLVMASLSNGTERVKVLLKHGADPNGQSSSQRETGVHIAARYGYLEVLRVLLEGGANPLLLDGGGRSPVEIAQLPETALTRREGSAPQQAVVALLKRHAEKYQNHLRSRTSKAQKSSSSGGTSSSQAGASSSAAAAAAAGMTAAASKDACDRCGVVPEGRKVQKCSRCSLRAYCSRECQKADWPTHKFPCAQIADIKDRVKQLLDTSASPPDRMYRARTMGESEAVHRLALDAKVIPQLVAALQSDDVITGGWLPSLIAVTGLLRDPAEADTPLSAANPTSKLHPVAVEQFVAAQGPTAVLKVLARRDLSDDQRIDSIRGMSGVIRLRQASKPLVSKGLAPQVVQLLKPFIQHSNSKVMTNAAFCLSHMLRTEQHLLKQQQQQQAPDQQTVDQQQQQQQREVAPVAAAVLEHIDLGKLAKPQGFGASRKGFFYQACMEFFPSMLHAKPAFKALRSQQPEVFRNMMDGATLGMALAATEAWAGNLEILYLCYRHGGLDLYSQQLRPLLLRYVPELDEDQKPVGVDSFVRFDELGPDWDMMSRGLFISCLMDAVEHDKAQVQLDTCIVRTWRSASLLLRVCWDTIPELRGLYQEFIDRLEDAIKRMSRSSPKEAEVLSELLVRIAAHHFCQKSRKAFTQQSEWLAAVKEDAAAAAALLDKHLGLAAGSSSSGSSSQRSVAVQRALKRIGRSEHHTRVGRM